jgi:DNA-binding transcriptional ArsR family regulator
MKAASKPAQIDRLLMLALSHPTRLEILGYLLRERGRLAGIAEGELAGALRLSEARVKYHLAVLGDAGLIAQLEEDSWDRSLPGRERF